MQNLAIKIATQNTYRAAGSLAGQSAHQHISVNKKRTGIVHWTGIWPS